MMGVSGTSSAGVVVSVVATETVGFGSCPSAVVAGRLPGQSCFTICITWVRKAICTTCKALNWSRNCERERDSISIPVSSPAGEGPAFDVERVSIIDWYYRLEDF